MSKLLNDFTAWMIRPEGLAKRTREAYCRWAKRFIVFHQKRHPQEMGAVAIEQFLSHLAVQEHCTPSTQNQAYHGVMA